MQFALIIAGTMLGLLVAALLGTASPQWFGALLGAAVGYAVAQFHALHVRSMVLETEVQALKERLADVLRRLKDAEADGRAVGVGNGAAPKVRERPLGGGAPQAGFRSSAEGVADTSPAQSSARSAQAGSAGAHAVAGSRGAGSSSGSSGLGAPVTSYSAASSRDAFAEASIFNAVREYFTGGNALVRVGILILFFGVAFLLRYVAEHSSVPVQARLSAVACGGLVLLVIGWRLRAKRSGYALALQGGGVGILYLTAFAALRLYSVLSPAIVLALLVFLAALSAVLAVLQNSQAFALLAVTGGFLAPLLASTDQGSHVLLFSYYAVLNASILAMAWYKAWRPLNFVGFAFTFVISTAWGATHYQSWLFSSTEPFLVLFFLFYVAIALLFSVRQAPQLRGYVDGTLVFGTPIAAFGYQSGMLHHRPAPLAASAVVVSSFYFTLAWLLYRRGRQSQRVLVEAFLALGVVFVTVATPLALDGAATGVTWALEGAALVWIGARQDRAVPRVFGGILQIVVALIQVSDADMFRIIAEPPVGLYLARAATAVAAVMSAVLLCRYAARLRPYEAASHAVLFFLGLVEWLFAGLVEVYRYAPYQYVLAEMLVFFTVTALLCSELSRRTALTVARLPALGLLPVLFLFAALSLVPPVHHPFDYGGWLAWPAAFVGFYCICRRHEGEPESPLASWLHVGSAWLLIALLSWQFAWFVDRGVSGQGSWPAIGWALVPSCALWLLPSLAGRNSWPLRTHSEAYTVVAAGGLAMFLMLWSLDANFTLPGDPYPFPYVPLLNALDLAQALVLSVLIRYWQYSRSRVAPSGATGDIPPATAILASLVFIWLNAALVRTLHRWAGVPFKLDEVVSSTLVQTSLSIFWTVLALATMLVAARRVSRPIWIAGAALLGITIVKLFVIDLSRVGTIERIVSFVGVGLLTLVIGYVSPLPPSATSRRTIAS